MEKVKKRKETKIKEPTTVCCLSICHSGEKHFFVCADWLLQKWLANAIHLYSFDMFILLSGLVRLWVEKKKMKSYDLLFILDHVCTSEQHRFNET